MNRGLYSAVAAQKSAQTELESITSNLANLNSIGHKRALTSTQSFERVLGDSIDRGLRTRAHVDFDQGQLAYGKGSTDLALNGSGFFVVETEEGEAYTRNGRFHFDSEGVLQTLDGLPVAWDGPNAVIDPNGAPVRIDSTGTVSQGDQVIGDLLLKDFAQPQRLQPDRLGYFHATPNMEELPSEATVIQGALESSNANAVDEMIRMVVVQRRFESATRMMSMIDQTYHRLTQNR